MPLGECSLTNNKLAVEAILSEAEREATRFTWEGNFSDYLRMVTQDNSRSRLSHALVYDAIMAKGSDVIPSGDRVYGLFADDLFGIEDPLDRIVRYFSAAAQRFEVRKRILLLLGPPASGKSSIADLIKRAVEDHTRTDSGVVYAIKGCPMQEEPLHLIPNSLRKVLYEEYGVYIEGNLCPRCRYLVRNEYADNFGDVPVERVVFSEQEAVGIGYFIANNPNPPDSSFLVGSINMGQLESNREEVAGKAFRLDGEFNVANRGLMEFVEMFKADKHLLTTLLSLAQEQIIKMEKFGSVYADEVIVGHSNQGDFNEFTNDKQSEALKDRIISIQIPYNLKVSEEVKIYQKMLRSISTNKVHVAPLTLQAASTFAVLARLDPPDQQTLSKLDKLRLYDGRMVPPFTRQDVREMRRRRPSEGMSGISPRYVMNRIGVVASELNISCITPLGALSSLWDGLDENVGYEGDAATKLQLISATIEEYNDLAIRDVQMAYEGTFEEKSQDMLTTYLANVNSFIEDSARDGYKHDHDGVTRERDMREIERIVGVADRGKDEFRREISEYVNAWQRRGNAFRYDSEPRLKVAIEESLLTPRRELGKSLPRSRFARQRGTWAQRWSTVTARLIESGGYCEVCAKDLIQYVNHVLSNRSSINTPRNKGLEWQWERFPTDNTAYGSDSA